MKKISMILPLLFTLLIVLSGCDKHDTTPPTIMLSGADLITIEVGEPYQELGATCIDDIDKTCQVTIDDTFLEVDRVGVYQIVYEAMDLSKNAAKSITRTVEVIDTTSPVIEIIGNSVIYHEVTESYHDLGAICVDNYDTNCSVTIDDSNLFIDIIGSYEVIYTASDSSSNEAIQVVRTVIVKDTTNPTIELIGEEIISVHVFDDYLDLGASCTDNFDVNCTITIDDSNVNTDVIGSYYVLYTATDQSGNHTTQTLRTVHVVDLESPEILLVGQSTLYISVNEAYVDMGASCIDNYDLACTVTINTDNLNTNLIGTYTVSYTAVDASNNIAIEATRTIIVQNAQNRIPSITQNDVIYHLVNQPWTYPTLYVPYEGDYLATRQGSVDESTLGTYDILYQITDELNNVFELHVLVIVVTDLPDELLFLNLQNIYNYYPSLYAILRDFDQNQDLYLDTQEASTITSLDVSGMNIKNIDFLSYLTNLKTLTVDDNNLYDLDFLENLTHLETLSARHNFLEASDLCVLSDSNLKHLDLSDNYISNLDCLVSMDSLADLNVMDNILSSIPLLASSTTLTQLNISHNSIDTLDDLLPYTNLITLDISNTLITDIYDIDFLSKLQNITLNENITNYYPIDYLPELKTVIIDQLDADLEQSFFFDYLMTYGISVTTKSMTSFDFVYPNILLLEDSKTITQGDTLDYSTLDLIVYDYYDLYMSEQIISNVPDTSVLTPGVHTITLSFTDSEGNTSSTNFEIQVLEDYDLGNIVIFIRFADELDFVSPLSLAYYNDLFNGTSSSLRDYYLEVSNNTYNINTILPEDEIIFFTDTYTRAYYQPYDEITNPIGYQDDDEGYYREQELLGNAINFVDAMGIFGDEEVLDYDNDNVIDVITFLISGQVDDWADLIWPHKYAMYTSIDAFGDFLEDAPTIHGKYAYEYTFQLIGDSEAISPYFDLSTFAHEMFHIIGAPDLYHYYSDDDIDPTGYWGLMNSTYDMPVHMLGYMKETYGNWDQDEILVQLNGTYVLNRTTLETNNLLVIDLGYSNEYLYLEYRTQNGEYEINLPGEGLLIYRVDSDYYLDGNVYGYYDESEVALEEVYLFRPSTFDNIRLANEGIYVIVDDGDPEGAVLSLQGINSAGPETTIPLFHSDGTPIHITITVVQEDTDSVTVQITWND